MASVLVEGGMLKDFKHNKEPKMSQDFLGHV